MPSLAIRLLLLAFWLGLGLWIGRRSRLAGTSILWYVVLGPVGLLLVAIGEWQRRRIGPDPATDGPPLSFAVPVRVNAEGQWRDGVLERWSTDAGTWKGWVTYDVDGAQQASWFSQEQVRRGTGTSDGSVDSPP